jgi:tetratricopeptide (TPR) repeat protein
MKNHEKSIEYFARALNIQLVMKNHLAASETSSHMAQHHKEQEQYSDALKSFQNALEKTHQALPVTQTKISQYEAEISNIEKKILSYFE